MGEQRTPLFRHEGYLAALGISLAVVGGLNAFIYFQSNYVAVASSKAATATEPVKVTVTPSGDTTGVTDANNIEAALKAVAPTGGTVELEEGHYYASREIVLCNLATGQGNPLCDTTIGGPITVKGAGKNKTIVEAVRKSASESFASANSPSKQAWINSAPQFSDAPGLFTFDHPKGITMEDMTLQVLDPEPTDSYSFFFHPIHGLSQFVFDVGGDSDSTFKNVRLRGADGDSASLPGTPENNLVTAILSFRSDFGLTASPVGIGDFTFKDSDLEDMVSGPTVSERRDSTITISGNKAAGTIGASGDPTDVGLFIRILDINNSVLSISDNEVHNAFILDLLLVRTGNSTIAIESNLLEGDRALGVIQLVSTSDATIKKNTIEGTAPFGINDIFGSSTHIEKNIFRIDPTNAAVRPLFSSNVTVVENDYKDSTLPGWTGDPSNGNCIGGPGAIRIVASSGTIVAEHDFPNGTTVATQVCNQGTGTIITDDEGEIEDLLEMWMW